MKLLSCIIFVFCLLACSCKDQKREQELAKKEAELKQKEQELLLKEKKLQLKEEELSKRDSSTIIADTAAYNPAIIGSWAVTMRCIETNCQGSAIGDIKNERWEINYQKENILARAYADKTLVRIYSGYYSSNTFSLVAQQNEAGEQPATMNVTLSFSNKNKFEGRREIVRTDGCKIIYAIELTR